MRKMLEQHLRICQGGVNVVVFGGQEVGKLGLGQYWKVFQEFLSMHLIRIGQSQLRLFIAQVVRGGDPQL